mmetsp:Transcript_6037/g.8788  ORF Transcript_6037/g.8788 Transcript_6037/m.8788 type:complete len:115 (+) Transcript_6037:722-1066(+)
MALECLSTLRKAVTCDVVTTYSTTATITPKTMPASIPTDCMATNVTKRTIYSGSKSLCQTSTSHSYKRSIPMKINVEPKKNNGVISNKLIVEKTTAKNIAEQSTPIHREWNPDL